VRNLGLSCLCMGIVALSGMLVTGWVGGLRFEERLTFCLAFLGFSVIWLAGGALVIVEAQVWLGIGLSSGLIAGLLVDRLSAFFIEIHLLPGTLAGFAVTIGVIVLVEWRAFARAIQAAQHNRAILPSPAYMLHEAAPYFVYGILYVGFTTVPHLLGWFGKLNGADTWSWATSSLEVGLTLAMLPLILVVGFPERTLRQFWQRATEAQTSISGLEKQEFSRVLTRFYRHQRRLYGVLLAWVSLVLGVPLWVLLRSGLLEGLIGPNTDTAVNLFIAALVSYYLIGQGLFNCMLCITLARPKFASRSVMAGMLVVLALGLPLTQGLDFRYCLVAFGAGAAVFFAVSSRLAQQVLSSADYYYYTAV
jgi:hypothetical protein